MLAQTILWSGVLLECLLLLRGLQGKLLARFPFFYFYILSMLLQTLLLFAVYHQAPGHYAVVYWTCQFVNLIVGSLVLFEIYRVALRVYPGTARVARNFVGFIFALTIAKVLVNQSYGAAWWPAKTTAELERNLRTVQAFAVLALLVVILVYAIPRDRNLKGILAGYGLVVANSIVQLSLLSHLGIAFQRVLLYIQPFSYIIVLGIWTVALWSPAREQSTAPSGPGVLQLDHAALVSRTEHDLQSIRLGLPGAPRR